MNQPDSFYTKNNNDDQNNFINDLLDEIIPKAKYLLKDDEKEPIKNMELEEFKQSKDNEINQSGNGREISHELDDKFFMIDVQLRNEIDEHAHMVIDEQNRKEIDEVNR